VCQHRNSLYPIEKSIDKTNIGEDYFVLFFTKPDYNSIIQSNEYSGTDMPTSKNDFSNAFRNRPNNLQTIIENDLVETINSGYEIKLIRKKNIKNQMILNNLIYILENNP